MFPLSNFLSNDPTLILGYKFPVAYTVIRVKPNLSPQLQNPTAAVPIPIEAVPI